MKFKQYRRYEKRNRHLEEQFTELKRQVFNLINSIFETSVIQFYTQFQYVCEKNELLLQALLSALSDHFNNKNRKTRHLRQQVQLKLIQVFLHLQCNRVQEAEYGNVYRFLEC